MFDILLPGTISQIVLSILVLTLAIAFVSYRRQNLPPGPWGIIPFLGYAPNIAYAVYQGEEIHTHLSKLCRRYGKCYSFTVLGRPIIVMNDLQSVREAFQDIKLSDRGGGDQDRLFSPAFNKLIDMDPFRKFILSSFRHFGIGTSGFEEPIAKESQVLIEQITKVRDKPVDPTSYFINAVSNIICQVVFGRRYDCADEKFQRLMYLLNRQNELAGAGGLDMFIPINIATEAKREKMKVSTELLQFIDDMIDEHRERFDPENLNDLIDVWLNELSLRKSADPNSFLYPQNMRGLILTLFLGGTDTSSTTLRWGVQYLVKYPQVQARIQQELDSLTDRNRLPKLADRSNLPYTQAFIAELHRITAIFPLGVFHVPAEATAFRGYTIPKNGILIANQYAVMHDPDVWKDSDVFRPERFLDEDGKLCLRDHLIAFGLGRRNCIGEALAKQEFFIFFSHLLYNFSFERPFEGAPLPTLKSIAGVVTHPEPYELRVALRE